MKKHLLAVVALGSAVILPAAQATSFDATWSVGNLSCTSSEGWQGCVGIDTRQHASVSIRVDDYTPTDSGFSSTVTISDTLFGNSARGPIGTFGSQLNASSFLSAQSGHSLGFTLASLNDFTPQGLLGSLANGDFNYTFGHSYFTGAVAGDMRLVSWRDTTLAPVPEPETCAMLLAGLAATGFLARRRKKI